MGITAITVKRATAESDKKVPASDVEDTVMKEP
jgi:hypothetical protein